MSITLIHAAEGRVQLRLHPMQPKVDMLRPARPVHHTEAAKAIRARNNELVDASMDQLAEIARPALREALQRYSALRAALPKIEKGRVKNAVVVTPQLLQFPEGEPPDLVITRGGLSTIRLRQIRDIFFPSQEIRAGQVFSSPHAVNQAYRLLTITNLIVRKILYQEDKELLYLAHTVCEERGQGWEVLNLNHRRLPWTIVPSRTLLAHPRIARRLHNRGLEGCRIFASHAFGMNEVYAFGAGCLGYRSDPSDVHMRSRELPDNYTEFVASEFIGACLFMDAPIMRFHVEENK